MADRKVTVEVSKFPKEDLGQSAELQKDYFVWCDCAPSVVANPDSMFSKCRVLPGSTKENFRLREVDTPTIEDDFTASSRHVYNYNHNVVPLNYSDIGMLPHINIPSVLDFLKQRYLDGQIYTTADPLLVAFNPFKDLGNCTTEWIEKYRDVADVSKLSPHVFSIAREALENLHSVHKNQTIIVSGESGAGKTEATKQIMRYFASAKSGQMNSRIQRAVMDANPVLEAFGNAKTVRNNNSSRFGRFMRLQVAAGGGIEFGSVKNFLIEKSRVITQDKEERSYHIFYQMLSGVEGKFRDKLRLMDNKSYKFINPHCTEVEGIDDFAEFKDVVKGFQSMNISEEMIGDIFSIVSGVLLLGNVTLMGRDEAGMDDAAYIPEDQRKTFCGACELLFLDPNSVENEITKKITLAGSQKIDGTWKREEGRVLKESLAKGIYEKLFDWIIRQLNANIEPTKGFPYFMGILDIFGYEVFKNNSLEQLFINITNEMLQKNFVDSVFERESRLFREEGIPMHDLVYTNNEPIVRILTAKKESLLAMLEDQCLAPGGTDEKFVSSCYSHLKGNDTIRKARVQTNVNFVVDHTIGDIVYNSTGFIFKNKDILPSDLLKIVKESSNPIMLGLFDGVTVEKGKLAKGQLIGSQFINQLDNLMTLINSTEPHFIRCVRPNESKKPLDWVASKTLVQLHSLSILEALQLRNLGYSYRRTFEDFLFQYRYADLNITKNAKLNPKDACVKLLQSAQITSSEWEMGKTMVFMRPSAAKDMANRQRVVMANLQPVVSIVEAMYLKQMYRRQMKRKVAYLIRIQANIRK